MKLKVRRGAGHDRRKRRLYRGGLNAPLRGTVPVFRKRTRYQGLPQLSMNGRDDET